MKFLARAVFSVILVVFFALAWVTLALAQSAVLLPNGKQQFLDGNGAPLAGGSVYFYVAPNTTTPKNTWQDAARGSLNANPVVLDASGEATIYGVGAYRQLVKDVFGTTVWDAQTSGLGGDTYGGVATGSANAIILAATDFANRNGQQVSFIAGFSNTGVTTLNASGIPQALLKPTTTGPAVLTAGDIIAGNYYIAEWDSVNGWFQLVNRLDSFTGAVNGLYNGSIIASQSGGALTVTLKTANGGTPSAASPVYYAVRSGLNGNGQLTYKAITTATATTISSGSTLGWASGQHVYMEVALSEGVNGGSYILLGTPSVPNYGDGNQVCGTDNGTGAADTFNILYGPVAAGCGGGTTVGVTQIGFLSEAPATAGSWSDTITFVSTPTPAGIAGGQQNFQVGTAVTCPSSATCNLSTTAFSGINHPHEMDVTLAGLSTNGTSGVLFQVCGLSTTYLGTGTALPNGGATAGANHTDGLFIAGTAAAAVVNGIIHVVYSDPPSNTVTMTFVGSRTDSAVSLVASSVVTCGAAFIFKLVSANGADTFDAGGAQI